MEMERVVGIEPTPAGVRNVPDSVSGAAPRLKVLLVASGGGHWVQLMRVASAFAEHDCVYVTTVKGCERDVGGMPLHLVKDANRWNRFGLLKLAFRMLLIVFRERPDMVVSTGAAPGYFALRFGKLCGAKTTWLDSVANIDRLSLSGQMVESYADLWLTQWPHLSRPEGPFYQGAVL
jgi:UDP-N-acetylglucosamine:LPS N-acetylglucosamine transferase